jgi:hypothetical protein
MRNSVQQSQSRENQKHATTTRWIANATVALLPVLACLLGGATQKWVEVHPFASSQLAFDSARKRFSNTKGG